MKKILSLALLALVLMLGSCTSGKYAAVNSLRTLSDNLANNSSYYDAQDWAKAKVKYENINNRIAQYNYTADEKAEIGELQGSILGYLAKGTVNTVVDKVTGVVNQVTGIVKGVKEAVGNNVGKRR